MLTRSEPTPPSPAGIRWGPTLRANGLVVFAIAVAALIGYFIEDHNQHARVRWYAQSLTLMLVAIGVIMAVSLQLINGVSGQFSLGHAGFMAIGAYLGGYASVTYNFLDPHDPTTKFQNVGEVFWYLFTLAVVMAAVGILLGVVFFILRLSRWVGRWVPPVLMLGTLAWFTWDFSAAFNLTAVPDHFVWTRLIRALGGTFDWMLTHGLPHARAVSFWIPVAARRPLCFLVLLVGGGGFAAAAGLLVGLPTLRLRGDYLAIATLGFAQIVVVVFNNSVALGGQTGLAIDPYSNKANPDRDPVAHHIFPWIMAVMVITVAVVWRIAYSPKGRMMRAVREDEIASAAVGINTTRQKVTAFIVGAFFAGVGGVLYIHAIGYAHAEQSFGIDRSLLFVIMVTLGGLGSISGAIVAGAFLTLLPFVFRQAAKSPDLPQFVRTIFENQLAVFAVLLIMIMLLRPRGLLGGHELWPRRKRRKPKAVSIEGVADA